MDRKLMMAWLQAQNAKQELTTTKMQQKRLGILMENEPPYKNITAAQEAKLFAKSAARRFDLRSVVPPGKWGVDARLKPGGLEDQATKNPHSRIRYNSNNEPYSLDSDAFNNPFSPNKPTDGGYVEPTQAPAYPSGFQTGRFGASGLNEQLSAEEEAYAKSHKSMMASMIKQYGKEKGTSVFYASVRNAVKKKKD